MSGTRPAARSRGAAGRRRLLLVAGGRRAVPLGVTCALLAAVADVVVVTSEEMLAEGADPPPRPGDVAALVVTASTAEVVGAAVEHARAHPVHGVLTLSDDAVEMTAEVAHRLGLPGQPVSTVSRFRDKAVQRARLAEGGLTTPAFAQIRAAEPEQVAAALEVVGLPAILKPTRASGGALAFVVTEPDEVLALVASGAAQAAGAGRAAEAGTAFVLEEIVVGADAHGTAGFAPYVSVETAAVGGLYRHLAVTDRFPQAPPVLETGMMLPSCLGAAVQQEVVETADAALRCLGFVHGVAHTEVMLTASGPVVIEVNARPGGAVPHLFSLAGGPDLVALAGSVALGDLPADAPAFDRHAVFACPHHPLGVEVLAVEGLEALREVPGVVAVVPVAAAGSRTTSLSQTTMVAAVMGVVGTPEEAVALHREVLASVRCTYRAVDVLPHHLRRPEDVVGRGGAPGAGRGGGGAQEVTR